MKWLDMPPVWLVLFIVAGWGLARVAPGWALGEWAPPAGFFLIVLGGALVVLASLEFRRARTTIIPHERPGRLISTGIYSYSRNPIYLGDTLILAGFVLSFGVTVPLVLVPGFVLLVRERFVRPEEARLEDAFGAAYRDWAAGTRRWI